ncbi:MAG: hypothetical protein WC022_01180, partial [Parcubacteria group bacterium]
MKKYAYNLWNKIKNQADIWFFFGFLLTFPLGVRKVLFFHPIQKAFNEYASGYLYISDIFFICTILSFILFLLCNNDSFLSIGTLPSLSTPKKAYLSIPLLLIIFSFVSICWSDHREIAIYRSLKLLEAYLIYAYLIIRFIPYRLFHMKQSKKQTEQSQSNSVTNVPRGTLDASRAPKNSYFCSEKNKS